MVRGGVEDSERCHDEDPFRLSSCLLSSVERAGSIIRTFPKYTETPHQAIRGWEGGLKMTQRVERRWRKTSKHWRSVRLAGPGGKHSLWSLVRRKIKPPGGSASSVARENYIRDSRKANWIRCSETSKNGGSQRSAGQVKNPGRQLSSIARSESGEGLVSSSTSATDERLAGSS